MSGASCTSSVHFQVIKRISCFGFESKECRSRPLRTFPLRARAIRDGPFFGAWQHDDASSAGSFQPLFSAFEAQLPVIRTELFAFLESKTPTNNSALKWRTEEAGLDVNDKWRLLLLGIDSDWERGACGFGLTVDHAEALGPSDEADTQISLPPCPFPRTCALLRATPLAQVRSGQAKFSLMRRGVRVRPHAGPSHGTSL